MATKEKNIEKKGFFKNLIDNVADNVKEGASFVGEKVAEGSAKAFVAGSEIVTETSEKIHDFTEKQSLQKEQHRLEERQIELKHLFGVVAFDHYLEKETLHKPFLTSTPISEILTEFKANENRLKVIAKEIHKLKNH